MNILHQLNSMVWELVQLGLGLILIMIIIWALVTCVIGTINAIKVVRNHLRYKNNDNGTTERQFAETDDKFEYAVERDS